MKRLNVENCIAYNECIVYNPKLFKEFFNDYLIFANNRFGYMEVSTGPYSNFYGLYVGTMVSGYNKFNWKKLRDECKYLSDIENSEKVDYLKNALVQENGHFTKSAANFIFKYDPFLYIMLYSKKYYGDVLIDFLKDKYDEETIDAINEYIDFIIDHIDDIDQINAILYDMKKHEIREFEIQKDVVLKLTEE